MCVFASYLCLYFVCACVRSVKPWYISNWNTIQCASNQRYGYYSMWMMRHTKLFLMSISMPIACLFSISFRKTTLHRFCVRSQQFRQYRDRIWMCFIEKVKVNNNRAKEWEIPAIIIKNIPYAYSTRYHSLSFS